MRLYPGNRVHGPGHEQLHVIAPPTLARLGIPGTVFMGQDM